MKDYVLRFFVIGLISTTLISIGWFHRAENCHAFEPLSPVKEYNLAHENFASFTSTLYVSQDGACGGMTPCYTTIQSAVDAAIFGGTIKIAGGPYYEDLNLPFSKEGDSPFIPLDPAEENGPAHECTWSVTKTLTLEGGWNPEIACSGPTDPESSKTTINSLTVSDGLAIINNLFIQGLPEGSGNLETD